MKTNEHIPNRSSGFNQGNRTTMSMMQSKNQKLGNFGVYKEELERFLAVIINH